MIDDLKSVGLNDLFDPGPIQDVAHDRGEFQKGKCASELQVDEVEGALGPIKEDHDFRFKGGKLPTDLGPDRPRGTCHQDPAPPKLLPKSVYV